MTTTKQVVGYCRSAAVPQRDASPIDRQKAALRRFAKRHGLVLQRFYCDAGLGGMSLERPGLQQLLRDCRAGRVGTVLTMSLDRLARSSSLTDTFLGHLRRAGVALIVSDLAEDDAILHGHQTAAPQTPRPASARPRVPKLNRRS